MTAGHFGPEHLIFDPVGQGQTRPREQIESEGASEINKVHGIFNISCHNLFEFVAHI